MVDFSQSNYLCFLKNAFILNMTKHVSNSQFSVVNHFHQKTRLKKKQCEIHRNILSLMCEKNNCNDGSKNQLHCGSLVGHVLIN